MFGFAASILFFDQITKALVRQYLALYESISIIPDFLDFRYVQNTGAAFGFLNNADIPFKPALMTAVALFALIAIGLYTSRLSSEEPLAKIGLTAIMGGACGNLADRISLGYVVDFINIRILPVFNLADVFIDIAIVLFFIEIVKLKPKKEKPNPMRKALFPDADQENGGKTDAELKTEGK